MSSFSFCVVSCLALVVSVQSFVVRNHVQFVDSAESSKDWLMRKDSSLDLTNESSSTTLTTLNNEPNTVETVDRDGLNPGANKCPIGFKRAGTACIPDEEYDDESGVETEERIGISGGFKKCPEGYKKAGTACVPDSDSKEYHSAAMPLEEAKTKISRCPAGYKQVGPACVEDEDEDYESEEYES